jgi:hypothetical protein
VLPQIEQGALFNAWNMKVASWLPENSTVVKSHIKLYVCPSDPMPHGLVYRGWLYNTPVHMAYSNYVGSLGSDWRLDYFDFGPGHQPDGVLFRDSNISTGDITDGTANTFMAAERTHPYRLLRPFWGFGDTGKVVADTSMGMLRPADKRLHFGFSSFHTSGCNILTADGAVHFISDNIDHGLFKSLSTRAGSENDARVPSY